MYLEDILAALSGGLRSGLGAYSFERDRRDEARRRQEELDERDQLRRERANDRGLDLMERDAARIENQRRYDEGLRRDDAAVTASLLEPNHDVDDSAWGRLQGTPYESRVRATRTLPSRTNPTVAIDALPVTPSRSTSDRSDGEWAPLPITARASASPGVDIRDAGGEVSRTWRPTAKEQQDLNREQERTRVLSSLPITARRAVEASDAIGRNLSPELLQTPEEQAAGQKAAADREFADWERRQNVLNRLGMSRDAARARFEEEREDPELPRAVETYVASLKDKPGYTFERANREIGRQWKRLQDAHPKISRLKVDAALRKVFDEAPDAARTTRRSTLFTGQNPDSASERDRATRARALMDEITALEQAGRTDEAAPLYEQLAGLRSR